MPYDNRIDIIEGIDVTKRNDMKECIFCHSWLFNHGCKFRNFVCNGSHDLTTLCLNISNIAIITVKGVDYCCKIHDISKSEAIHLLGNSVLDGQYM